MLMMLLRHKAWEKKQVTKSGLLYELHISRPISWALGTVAFCNVRQTDLVQVQKYLAGGSTMART